MVSWREDSNYNSARRYAKGKLNLKIKKRKPTHSAMTMIHFLLLLVKLWEGLLEEAMGKASGVVLAEEEVIECKLKRFSAIHMES